MTGLTFHREREMRWLAEHEAEYAGELLAPDEDRLLSHGKDPHEVRAEARAMGMETPFVVFAENSDEFFTGGWLYWLRHCLLTLFSGSEFGYVRNHC
jgi:hypothetical protein